MTDPDSLADRDDVPRSAETVHLDAEEFETVCRHVEAGRDRWVGAFVRDDTDAADESRIVLVRNRWGDGWVLPGGTVELGETLREAVVREVREETGLDATVERPLEVVEQTFESDGSAASGRFVVFEARASDTELGDDLGVDADEIADAAWFDAVPDESEQAGLLTRHF
ncbi:NUDIX hydrolase [Halorussus caseinilyticus]|uniref:NUDIX hydrolase n=1 Tax=Halorussus caseinilyticus TaxID=3034025 RepID=A0ABD5WIS3_9EURY|nr:NUDIX hydrolase [Halorussus sp. DT72]